MKCNTIRIVILLILGLQFKIYSQYPLIPEMATNVTDKIVNGNLVLKGWFVSDQMISSIFDADKVIVKVNSSIVYESLTPITAEVSISSIYNNAPLSSIASDGSLFVLIEYYNCIFNCTTPGAPSNPLGFSSRYIKIIGGRKWNFYQNNYCSKSSYYLSSNEGVLNHQGGVYSIAGGSPPLNTIISNNILDLSSVTNSGNVNIQYTVTLTGTYPGTYSRVFNKQIIALPNVVWINNDIQNGQTILTSDPCINLSGTAGCSNCTNFYYQSTGIVNGTGTSFCPNISGAGSHGINAVGEVTVGNTTCINQEYQLLNVTYDPGTPPIPSIDLNTSGYMNFFNSTLPPPVNSHCMHVCDGQTLSLRAGSNLPVGVNVVEYSYVENGNIHIIGEFPKNTTITWEIPTRNSVRQDIFRVRGKSTLGIFGSYNSIPVYVNKATNIVDQISLDTNCIVGSFLYNPIQYTDNNGQSTSNLFFTQIGTESYLDYELTNTDYRLFDEFGNLYLANTFSGYIHTLNDKYDTLFLVSSTKVPFDSQYRGYIGNPQSCVRKDTILVVQNPIVSFGFNGASVASVGELYQFISNNQYHDYTTWEFGDGSGIYTGDTMYHYMNDMGYYNITCTAWDNWGCNDANTLYSAIFVGDWTSVDEMEVLSDVIAYPNPIIDYVDISLNSQINGSINFELISLSGQLIISKEIDLQVGNQLLKISELGHIASGTYFIVLKGTDFNYSSKIVKQ